MKHSPALSPLSPQLSQRVEEGSVIGKPGHNWQSWKPLGSYFQHSDETTWENIWKCSECPAWHPQRYGDPQVGPYLIEHDRTCPCLCIVCSGEYQQIKDRHLLERAPETSYLEVMLAVKKESDAWTLKRKQEEGRQ
jgi:hypothetical protein